MTGNSDLIEAVAVATWVGGLLATVVIGLIVYLAVRPVRRGAEPPPPREVGLDGEMLRLMERMEQRLAALEHAVAARRADGDRILAAGPEGPETRRRK